MIEDYADLHYKYGNASTQKERKDILKRIGKLHKQIKDVVYE